MLFQLCFKDKHGKTLYRLCEPSIQEKSLYTREILPEQANLCRYLWKETKHLNIVEAKSFFFFLKKKLMEANAIIKNDSPNVSIFAQL